MSLCLKAALWARVNTDLQSYIPAKSTELFCLVAEGQIQAWAYFPL